MLKRKEAIVEKHTELSIYSEYESINRQIFSLDEAFLGYYNNLMEKADISELGELSRIFNPILKELKSLVIENNGLLTYLNQKESNLAMVQKENLVKSEKSDLSVHQRKIKAYKKF